MVGQTISHYRILEKLGEGGMGVIYRSEDTRLERTVALKFLAPHIVADEDLKKRFEREAKAAASLDHPNICTVFEIGESDGRAFIAMAYVHGKTIKDKIAERPLKLSEVLDIALQTAQGLQAAHEKGIVHRDVKPANVMINTQGQVKIMDFGLAYLSEGTRLTNQGSTLGTPAYMAPEQAEGRSTDARTDIWSLGVMLYEMVTGQLPFSASKGHAIVHAIVHEDPEPVTALRAGVPIELDLLIEKCLAKSPARRYQHAADLIVDLESLKAKLASGRTLSLPAEVAGSVRKRTKAYWKSAGLIAAGVLLTAVVGYLWNRSLRPSAPATPSRTVKFVFTPARLGRGGDANIDTEVSVSRDGKHIAYVEAEGGQLYLRDIDQEKARPVPGATRVYQAFWSPDSQSIGYAVGRELLRIPAQGGTPTLITKMEGPFRRASWSADGETIVYCDSTGLYTVPSRGGPPTRVIEHSHIEHPSWLDLPDGRRAFLYQTLDPGPAHEIFVQVSGEKQRHFVVASSSSNPYPAYSPTGHIVYVDGFGDSLAIWALPFSLKTLKATGKAFPIAYGASSPQVSATGTLVYSDAASDLVDLTWCDRTGKTISSIGGRQLSFSPSISPDGKRLAVWIREGGPAIWIYELDRPVRTRVTFDTGIARFVAWSPNGNEVLYSSRHSGGSEIVAASTSGSGEKRPLVSSPEGKLDATLSSDQKYLIYQEISQSSKSDLIYREVSQGESIGSAQIFLRTPFNEYGARFAPNGRYVSYVSDESGRAEVYVRDFPKGAAKWQVSANGGVAPRWRRDGSELFYIEGKKLMSVSVNPGAILSLKAPQALFERNWVRSVTPEFDVMPDGKRFIVKEGISNEKPLSVHVSHNWFEEFRGR